VLLVTTFPVDLDVEVREVGADLVGMSIRIFLDDPLSPGGLRHQDGHSHLHVSDRLGGSNIQMNLKPENCCSCGHGFPLEGRSYSGDFD
jgi:hypothetical protein